jgi:uncharacterized protein (DUF433 family)
MLQLNAALPSSLVWQDGEVRIRGHRIGLYDVIKRHRKGASVSELVGVFPTLSGDEVCEVLDFYRAHRSAVDAYLADFDLMLHETQSEHSPIDLDQLRERFRSRYGHDLAPIPA